MTPLLQTHFGSPYSHSRGSSGVRRRRCTSFDYSGSYSTAPGCTSRRVVAVG